MSCEKLAADLTSSGSVRFHCAEEAEDTLHRMVVPIYELRQLGRGSFRMDMSAFLPSEGLAVSRRLESSVHCPLHTPDGMVTLITFSKAEG